MRARHGLSRPTAIYLAANVASSIGPLLLLPVMTRVLTPEDFGIVAMFTMLQALLAQVVGLRAYTAIATRYFRGGEQGLAHFVMTCLVLTLASALGAALVIWPIGDLLAAMIRVPTAWLFVAILGAAAQSTMSVQISLWQAQRMPVRLAVLLVAQSVMKLGFSLVFVLGAGLAWEGRVLGEVLSLAACAGIALAILWSDKAIAWPPRKADASEALAFGLPLIPQGLGTVIFLAADRFLLTNFLGVEQTGIYAAAFQIAMGLGILIEAFNRAYTPWLFAGLQEDMPGFRQRVVRGVYLYGLVAMGLAFATAIAAPLIVAILLGESFGFAATLVPYLAVGLAFRGLYYLISNQMLFMRATGKITLAAMIGSIVHIVLIIVLIMYNGVTGAAQAFMLSQAILLLMTWRMAHGALPMPWLSSLSRTARDWGKP